MRSLSVGLMPLRGSRHAPSTFVVPSSVFADLLQNSVPGPTARILPTLLAVPSMVAVGTLRDQAAEETV
jgi:hypothetical protein